MKIRSVGRRGTSLIAGVLALSLATAAGAAADEGDPWTRLTPRDVAGQGRLTRRRRPDDSGLEGFKAALAEISGSDSDTDVAAPAPTDAQDLPPVLVTAPRVEDGFGRGTPIRQARSSFDRVGPNRQPLWTTHRRFASTRAYVNAPWQVEFESWWEGKFKKSGDERHRYLQEVGIGLPGRVQLDFYWRVQHETGEDTRWSDFQIEGRWALAKWDCLLWNPTIYLEYKLLEDEPDVFEAKLLLADDIGCRWQWAANLFYERQLGGSKEVEMGISAALGYTVCDPSFSVGIEAKFEHVTEAGARDDPEIAFLLGPTIQWRPTRNTHLDIAPLFGLTDDSPDAQVYVVFGIDLFPGTSQGRTASLPTSSRAR